jgi:hypothetical protein
VESYSQIFTKFAAKALLKNNNSILHDCSKLLRFLLIMKFSLSFEMLGSHSLADKKRRMKPTFDQALRLLVCVAGIVFFSFGIWMIKTGTSAQGVIDIKFRELLSGHLETGSAGLFIVFMSFLMILFSFLIGRHPVKSQVKKDVQKQSRMPVMVTVTILLWLITSAFYLIARDTKSDNESLLFGVLTFLFFIGSALWSMVTIGLWMDETEGRQQ